MIRVLMLAAFAASLSACGLKGDLETPPPLWGDPNRDIVERELPSGRSGQDDTIVFTRDDVDLFQDEETSEEEDPFAERDAAAADESE